MQTFFTQVQLPLLLTSLSLCAIHSHGSPLSNSNSSDCPKGWYQYDQFCVTRAEGQSDRDVAVYCDGFGGIGIKGLCIIKRNILEASSDMDLSSATNSDTDNVQSPYRESQPQDYSLSSVVDTDIFGNTVGTDEDVCPRGWSHYRRMCVYKPMSLVAMCNLFEAVEFHGLCIKHADIKAVYNRDLEAAHHKEKRICCCANFKARGNKYGC
ncbi:hypothetical protein BsWGS_04441 [Bradybaena similaris]